MGWLRKTATLPEAVKPIALMRYLVRMVTPPNGTCLDPFAGSGSTGVACVQEGFDFIGIESEEEYVEIAQHRITHAQEPEKSSKPKTNGKVSPKETDDTLPTLF